MKDMGKIWSALEDIAERTEEIRSELAQISRACDLFSEQYEMISDLKNVHDEAAMTRLLHAAEYASNYVETLKRSIARLYRAAREPVIVPKTTLYFQRESNVSFVRSTGIFDTIEEASLYFRIGENKLRNLINKDPNADFILWNGNRAQIKRKKFELYIDRINLI